MRVRALLLASCLAVATLPVLAPPGVAGAQDRTAQAPAQTDPDTGERYRLERPPEGMQRGPWQVPGWVVAAGGAVVALSAAGVLAWRALRRRR